MFNHNKSKCCHSIAPPGVKNVKSIKSFSSTIVTCMCDLCSNYMSVVGVIVLNECGPGWVGRWVVGLEGWGHGARKCFQIKLT